MQTSPQRDERVMAIVAEALRRLPGERDTYVRDACQGDEALLREIGEAVEWEERMSGFLRDPAASAEPTPGLGAPGAGTAIGPYRLLEKIGEGGMAEVWRGEQTTPVHRTVAIKLIKAGMESKAMIARFESERQALALMDHPAIARVFDAGATAEGRPYFVMEYVPGMPITEYCDRHRLSTRERLELFLQVCRHGRDDLQSCLPGGASRQARGRIRALREAIDHGYRIPNEMANDEDLKSLHGDSRFNAMLAEVKRLAAAK